MDIEKIISGLQFTIDIFLFNPFTGETINYDSLNEMEKITVDACRNAIKVLEKQIQKKPDTAIDERKEDCNKDDVYICPECGSYLGDILDCQDEAYQSNYCSHCGQAIDWEGIE